MLKLKRRVGEEIVINEMTRIIVTKTGPKTCEIAIEAPLSQHIRRGEISPDSERVIQRTASYLRTAK